MGSWPLWSTGVCVQPGSRGGGTDVPAGGCAPPPQGRRQAPVWLPDYRGPGGPALVQRWVPRARLCHLSFQLDTCVSCHHPAPSRRRGRAKPAGKGLAAEKGGVRGATLWTPALMAGGHSLPSVPGLWVWSWRTGTLGVPTQTCPCVLVRVQNPQVNVYVIRYFLSKGRGAGPRGGGAQACAHCWGGGSGSQPLPRVIDSSQDGCARRSAIVIRGRRPWRTLEPGAAPSPTHTQLSVCTRTALSWEGPAPHPAPSPSAAGRSLAGPGGPGPGDIAAARAPCPGLS